jgi:hypothetical protein
MKQEVYVVKSEYKTPKGYIDIMMFRRYKEITYNIMIELKYLKTNDADEKTIQQKITEAKEQLKKYSDCEEFQNDKHLNKYVVIAVGKKIEKIVKAEF